MDNRQPLYVPKARRLPLWPAAWGLGPLVRVGLACVIYTAGLIAACILLAII